MAIFQVLAKIIVFGNYFSPIVPLRSFKFFFLNLMLASLNYKLHLYFKSHYTISTSDLMSLNMVSNFRNNELALFVFSPHIILQICKRSAKQIALHLKKNYISLIFISSYIFSQILPRSGYVTTTTSTAAVQEFTEKDKSVTKRVSTS